MYYQLIRTYDEPQTGSVRVPTTELTQIACTLLGQSWLSQVERLAATDDYQVYTVANAKDYALPNLAGRLAVAQAVKSSLRPPPL